MHKFLFAACIAALCAVSTAARADWTIEFVVGEPVQWKEWINPIRWEVGGQGQCWYRDAKHRNDKTRGERYDNGKPGFSNFHDENNTLQTIVMQTDPDNEFMGPCQTVDKWMELTLKSWGRHRNEKTGETIEDELMVDRLFSFKITGGGLFGKYRYHFQGEEVASSYWESKDLCTRITFYGTQKPDKIEKC